MATTVSYKDQILTTITNNTKTLKTAGTWLEDDIKITDVSSTAAVAVEDIPNEYNGIEKRITAINISDTTATAEDVVQGKVFYSSAGTRTTGTAVNGEWTTEGIARGTEPNGDIKLSFPVKDYAFYKCTGIVSVEINAGVTSFGSHAFDACSSLTAVTGSGYTFVWSGDGFKDCTSLRTVNLLNKGRFGGTNLFNNCTALEEFRAPYSMLQENGNEWAAYDSQMPNGGFRGCTSLRLVDYGHACGQFANCFLNCTALRTLILRRVDGVCGIDAWNASAMGGIYNNPTESTIYVPQALISSYQTATNWSTGYAAGLTFLPIEGSEYELWQQ